MGKSAKLHKRVKAKGSTKPGASSSSSAAGSSSVSEKVQSAKKKATTKSKAKAAAAANPSRRDGEHVLGGADYVSVMMGGRRKARQEAKKLPVDEEMDDVDS